LASYSVQDLLSEEFWGISKNIIQLAFSDLDIGIATEGLKIYSRGFTMAPGYLVPEIYLSFTQQIQKLIQRSPKPLRQGLDVKNSLEELRLKQFRLLSQFMVQIPLLWSRFPEQQFKQVMNSTVLLLKPPNVKSFGSDTLPTSKEPLISALHYLAIVDPESKWYNKWMISNLGRSHLIGAMQVCGMIPFLAESFLQYSLKIFTKNDIKDELLVEDFDQNDDDNLNLIKTGDIEYLHFLNVTKILARLLMWSAGRQCFPIPLANPIDLSMITGKDSTNTYALTTDLVILSLIRCIYGDARLSMDVDLDQKSKLESYRIPIFISKILKELVNAQNRCENEIFKVTFF
jgi:hypothetical protein